ncbi:hypothetical protein [Staphylospora marina]|uniref:hypothetical protein n=1 Tax=Staphylospora marina TaxID=2490858 RepID=UPI000F5B8C30|nr:hypothetical protein [Staphylospora marina]
MKFRVIHNFIDKYTKVYYPEGTVFETDSDKRVKELRELGFIGEEIESEKPKPKAKKKANTDENQ